MARPFLTARWSNVFLATYAVPPELLLPRLPPGLDLDLRGNDAFVSLVAFDFEDTRVWGVPWPGYQRFAELNLRYYVRQNGQRGVVFVREIVPARAVAWAARWLYHEPYVAAPLTTKLYDHPDRVTVERVLRWRGKRYVIAATGEKPPYLPDETSLEHFFKEHQWGFGRDDRGRTVRYEVAHAPWQVYRVKEHHIELDWAAVYGEEWGVLQDRAPHSVALAVGSPIAVWPKAHAELRVAAVPAG